LETKIEDKTLEVQQVILLLTTANFELNVLSLLKPQPVAFDSSANRFDNTGIYKQEFPG